MNHEWTASLHFLRHCSNLQKKLRYPHLPLVDKDFEVLVKKKKKCSPLSFLRNLLSMLRGGIKFIMCFLYEHFSSETDSASWFLDRYKLGLYNAFKHIYYMFIYLLSKRKRSVAIKFFH